MSFGEKITSFVTGKNKIERMQERAANKQIRLKQNAAYYQEKERQAINIAQAKARHEAKIKIASFSKPKPQYSSPFGGGFGLGGLGGSPSRKGKKEKRYNVFTGKYN